MWANNISPLEVAPIESVNKNLSGCHICGNSDIINVAKADKIVIAGVVFSAVWVVGVS